ncbi:M23 family metallopeptidase [bacterium AH-315-G05]|nr:M23 family metallopeptidase [bacterium AH-315-G05]
MNKQKLIIILQNVGLAGSLVLVTSWAVEEEILGKIAFLIFFAVWLPIPYLKKPNKFTKFISGFGILSYVVGGIGYIVWVAPYLDAYPKEYGMGYYITRFFVMIPIVFTIGIVFVNTFLPWVLEDKKRFYETVKDEDEEVDIEEYISTRANNPTKTTILLYLSQLLMFFNPFIIVQNIRMLVGFMMFDYRKKGKSDNVSNMQKEIEYHLPCRGEWIVANGGIRRVDSHSWDLISQRYAYDFIKIDTEKYSSKNEGKELEDYYCYGEELLAPADGIIEEVKDNIRDAKNPGTLFTDFLTTDIRGNFVVIKHAENEYSVLAHLIPNSITVKVGNKVKRGKVIGKCGNSGNSSEPHLHFQLQDRASFYFAYGLAIKFSNLKINGVVKEEGYIGKGEKVENLS